MATYTKLQSGNWGIRLTGSESIPAPGDKVTVSKKDGTTKLEIVDKLVHQGDGYALCSIRQAAAPQRASKRRCWPGMECPSCGSEPLNRALQCWECGFSGR